MLVDELAHTNAPGSRHAKRWQDVLELLDAGINVYTAMNVQHVESLNDVVAEITGVIVRETVPDSIFEHTDEVELIDLPPDDLLHRLRDGKIYVPDQAREAAENFFRKGNLIALRELALRVTAQHVDAEMRHYMRDHAIQRTWPVRERLLVCIGPSPSSIRLVRAAKRMAEGLGAEWIVAYVETPAQTRLSQDARDRVAQTMRLAEQLGAETHTLTGARMSDEILAFARARNVSKIVVGKPERPLWRRIAAGSIVDALVQGSGEIDVYVISGDRDEPRPLPPRAWQPQTEWAPYGAALVAVAIATAIAWAMFPYFAVSNLIMVYLLGVIIVATRYGRGALPARLDPERGRLRLLLRAALLHLRGLGHPVPRHLRGHAGGGPRDQQPRRAHPRPGRVGAGARAAHGLALRDEPRAGQRAQRRRAPRGGGAAHRGGVRQPGGRAAPAAGRPSRPGRGGRRALPAGRERAGGRPVGLRARAGRRAGHRHAPRRLRALPAAHSARAAAWACSGSGPWTRAPLQAPEQLHQLEAFASQTALAIERAQLAEEAERAQVRAETERLRNSLLSSVSHDLRTPLASITGAASTLLENETHLDAGTRRDLLESLHEEADRLNRLVQNLLEMTRLESGTLQLHTEWHPVEEVVGAALGRFGKALARRAVTTRVPADLPLVPMDDVLIEQVLINLLDNALKYTPAESPIEVSAEDGGGAVLIEVADRGPGLPAGEERRIFEKFHRAETAPSQRGAGLGLAICRGIVHAHGGRIWAENRPGGGVSVRFTLPVKEAPPILNEADG